MIAVTGATGNLGQLAIEELIAQGTKPQNIIAVVRNPAKAQDLAQKGVQVREANYNSAESLEKAFAGVEKLLLISGSEVGQRLTQHTNIVNSAVKAKVQLIAYTSILKADQSKMSLANEHLATEKVIQKSGIPYVILRNGWYIENYLGQLAVYLQHGAIAGAAKEGKVSAATRADYARAAVAAILGKAKVNTAYELGGGSFTLSELAKIISEQSGQKVSYQDMPAPDYAKFLTSVGVPAPMADVLADSDLGIIRGDLFTESKDLESLIGRKTTSLKEAVTQALKN